MKTRNSRAVAETFFLLVGSWVVLVEAGCASTSAEYPITERTSKPLPVSSIDDNGPVLRQLVPSLVLTLHIREQRVELTEGVVRLTPPVSGRRFEEGTMRLQGWRDGQLISTLVVPDERLNVQEGKGLVVLDERQVVAALAVPVRLDTVTVQLGPEQPEQKLDVRTIFEGFCKEFPRSIVCRRNSGHEK